MNQPTQKLIISIISTRNMVASLIGQKETFSRLDLLRIVNILNDIIKEGDNQ